MLVYYNGDYYDKDVLLSHLNKVLKQIESVDRCCTPDNSKQSSNLQSKFIRNCGECHIPCHHQKCCEPLLHCCCRGDCCVKNKCPRKCQLEEICESEQCSGCHHSSEPTLCHHHSNKKCILLHEEPIVPRKPPCVCCTACKKEPFLIIPDFRKNSDTKVTSCKKIPCISFPESLKNIDEKENIVTVCKHNRENFGGNPFIINNNRGKAKCQTNHKNTFLASPANQEKCECDICSCEKQEKIQIRPKCVCCKNNGLQDNCKLCLMPRGRLGYLRNKR